MAILLSQLIKNAEKNYNMKLVAGKGGLDNTVRWVHMVEDSDVPTFLHGNELVFTTGIGHSGTDWLERFVKSLNENKSAGLVINIGPYIDAVPTKVIVYCEEHNFPLFTLPWEVKIIDITYNFCRRIIDNEEAEISISDAFRKLIFSEGRYEEYAPVLNSNGFEEKNTYSVFALSAENNSIVKLMKNECYNIWKYFRRSRFPVAIFFHAGTMLVIKQLVPKSNISDYIEELGRIIANPDIRVGISDTADGFNGIREAYRQAVSALSVSKINEKTIQMYKDTGVYKLLFGIENRAILKDYVNTVLGKIIECDSLNGTEYEKTLSVYFRYNGSVQLVAEALGVHRNTINHRMKALREMLGIELTDENKMNILLALYARGILENNK